MHNSFRVSTLRIIYTNLDLVDLRGFEPLSEQHILGHAKILFVNVLMISQNIRFKAILKPSKAFYRSLWLAIPLRPNKRL